MSDEVTQADSSRAVAQAFGHEVVEDDAFRVALTKAGLSEAGARGVMTNIENGMPATAPGTWRTSFSCAATAVGNTVSDTRTNDQRIGASRFSR